LDDLPTEAARTPDGAAGKYGHQDLEASSTVSSEQENGGGIDQQQRLPTLAHKPAEACMDSGR